MDYPSLTAKLSYFFYKYQIEMSWTVCGVLFHVGIQMIPTQRTAYVYTSHNLLYSIDVIPMWMYYSNKISHCKSI